MESDEKNKIDIKFQQVRRRPPGKARSAQHELKNFTVYFFYILCIETFWEREMAV